MALLCPLCRGDGTFRIATTPVECPCGAARTLRQLGAALALADESWNHQQRVRPRSGQDEVAQGPGH